MPSSSSSRRRSRRTLLLARGGIARLTKRRTQPGEKAGRCLAPAVLVDHTWKPGANAPDQGERSEGRIPLPLPGSERPRSPTSEFPSRKESSPPEPVLTRNGGERHDEASNMLSSCKTHLDAHMWKEELDLFT